MGRSKYLICAVCLFLSILELNDAGLGILPSETARAAAPVVEWASEYTYGPFEIFADFDVEEVRSTMEELYRLDTELCRLFHFGDGEKRIQLYILSDKKRYYDFVLSKFPTAPFRRALYAMEPGSPGQVFLFRHEDFAVDLRHECTHALIHLRVDQVPIWLDEGLAEFFEVPASERLYKEPYFKQIKRNNSFGFYPDLQKLEKINTMELFLEKNYRDSWSWAHFLLAHEDTRECLAEYLRQCQAVTLPEGKKFPVFPSFKRLLERTRPNLKADYRSYWDRQTKPTDAPSPTGSAGEKKESKSPGWNPLKLFGL